MEKYSRLEFEEFERKIEYYKSVVLNSNDAVIIQDFNGVIKSWNRAAQSIYGFSEKEMLGQNISKIIVEAHREEAMKNIAAVKNGHPTFKVHQIRITKDKKEVDVNITYSPIYEKDEIIEIATTEEDTTKLKNTLEKLEKTYAQLKNIEEFKSVAMRNVSHELRAPISKIKMFSMLLMEELNKSGDGNKKAKEYGQYLVINSDSILSEIQLIIEWSKLENTSSIVHDKVDFRHICEKVINVYESQISNKGLKLIKDIKADFEFIGNSRLIEKLIRNIIDNAIKFTIKGKITISLYCENGEIYFSVEDSGIGISSDKLDKLFIPYNKIEQSNKGLGVGLAMCKKIVELHNGQIFMQSKLGKGSKFIIKIPLNN